MVNATTLARVRAYLGIAVAEPVTTSTAERDALLTVLVDGVSREIEGHLGFPLLQASRAEFYSPSSRIVQLNVVPIVSVSEVRTASEGSWDYTAGLALTADQHYRLRGGRVGELFFLDGVLIYGFETLKVTYTAGFGTTDALVIAAASDLADAADMQVAEEWRRRADPQTISRPGPKGATALASPLVLMPRVRQILSRYRRRLVC